MKVYGKHNIFSGAITSNVAEEADKAQNILPVEKLSEFDTSNLDPEITVLDKDKHQIAVYDDVTKDWRENTIDVIDDISGTELEYNYIVNDHLTIHTTNTDSSNHISIDKSLFDFGPPGSQLDFVVDFILVYTGQVATYLYNGKNVGQVDLEVNKNFLVTTNGAELVKDPNYQVDPTIVQHSEDNHYLNVLRPRLKSKFKLAYYSRYHVAIVRSGDIIYLVINGHIHDSAPAVDYFAYDDVMLGSGYASFGENIISSLRVTKGSDRGWTKEFTPPLKGDDDGCDFVLDTTSLVDLKGNYSVNTIGSPTYSLLTTCYPIFVGHDYRKVKVNISADPDNYAFVVLCDNEHTQDYEMTFDTSITEAYIQNTQDEQINYEVLGVNSKILKYSGRDSFANRVLTIKRGKSNTWFQDNDAVLPLLLPWFPQIDSGSSLDSNATESMVFSSPRAVDVISLGSTSSYPDTAFVDQEYFNDIDLEAFNLTNSSLNILNPAGRPRDSRVDMIIYYKNHPTTAINFYAQSDTHGSRAIQMNTTGQIYMYMPYTYRCGYFSNCTGSANGWTTSLVPGTHYFISLQWDGFYGSYGTCYVRCTITNLDTNTVIQNATIGSAYQNPYSSYAFSVVAPNIYHFYSGTPVNLLAYRRRSTAAAPVRNTFDNISQFWNNA